MSKAYIWPADLAEGNLPRVCVRTGAPADTVAHVKYISTPAWTFLAIFFNIFAFVLVRVAAARRAAGVLPVSHDVARRVRLYRRVPVGLMAVAVLSIGFALVLGDQLPEAGVAAFATAFGAFLLGLIVLLAVDAYPARGRIVEDSATGQRWVVLHGVHPAFAEAVAARYSAGVVIGPPAGAF